MAQAARAVCRKSVNHGDLYNHIVMTILHMFARFVTNICSYTVHTDCNDNITQFGQPNICHDRLVDSMDNTDSRLLEFYSTKSSKHMTSETIDIFAIINAYCMSMNIIIEYKQNSQLRSSQPLHTQEYQTHDATSFEFYSDDQLIQDMNTSIKTKMNKDELKAALDASIDHVRVVEALKSTRYLLPQIERYYAMNPRWTDEVSDETQLAMIDIYYNLLMQIDE